MTNLSTNIDTLTAEILIYKEQAGRCVFEIGKRLKQVKESLPHGAWLKYLEEKVEFTRQTANQFIRCYEEFANVTSTLHLPTGHLFELLTLPEEQREPFIKENNVADMTQKQLREAIKAQKEAEARADAAEAKVQEALQKVTGMDRLKMQVEILEDKLRTAADPIVVEQPVEVFPPDYERLKRENAQFKAHKQGIQQVNETCQQSIKTIEEEEKLAKTVIKILGTINNLPAKQEIDELARCYLKHSPADTVDEITVTCKEIEIGIAKLVQLQTALKETTKLRVVK